MHTALEFFSRFFRQEKQAGQSRAEELYILPGILGALLSPHPLKMQREAQSRGRRAAGRPAPVPAPSLTRSAASGNCSQRRASVPP